MDRCSVRIRYKRRQKEGFYIEKAFTSPSVGCKIMFFLLPSLSDLNNVLFNIFNLASLHVAILRSEEMKSSLKMLKIIKVKSFQSLSVSTSQLRGKHCNKLFNLIKTR